MDKIVNIIWLFVAFDIAHGNLYRARIVHFLKKSNFHTYMIGYFDAQNNIL